MKIFALHMAKPRVKIPCKLLGVLVLRAKNANHNIIRNNGGKSNHITVNLELKAYMGLALSFAQHGPLQAKLSLCGQR